MTLVGSFFKVFSIRTIFKMLNIRKLFEISAEFLQVKIKKFNLATKYNIYFEL